MQTTVIPQSMPPADDSVSSWPELKRTEKTIAVIDVVESVRLMQLDEVDVIDRWRRFVHEVRATVLSQFRGRMVKSLGDGMLLEFAHPPAAVDAALAIQQTVHRFNEGRANDLCIALRIGIHTTELVVDELDVYGAGVNLAARLASLADPGGIVVSVEVQSQLRDGLHVQLRDLGLCYLKHIETPVRAFGVAPATGAKHHAVPDPSVDFRPGLAVIPFAGDGAEAAFGFALADDIIAALSRNPGLRLISRLSTAPLAGQRWDPLQLQRLLGVTYVLSGSFVCRGDSSRVRVELCDARDEAVVWASSGSVSISELFEGRDELVPYLVREISRRILTQELERVRSLPMKSLQAYSLYLGADGLMSSLVPRDFDRARQVLEHLVARHPRQAASYALQAKWHVFKMVQGWSQDLPAEAAQARDCARRAIDLDPGQVDALAAEGLTRLAFDHDLEAASDAYDQALSSDPQNAYVWSLVSGLHSLLGNRQQAIAASDTAMELSPLDPNRFLFQSYSALARFCNSEYEASAISAGDSIRHNALHVPSHRLLVASLWLCQRHDEARQALAQYLKIDPAATVGQPLQFAKGANASVGPMLGEALLAAGLPR